MSLSQSKLQVQLMKEQKNSQKNGFSEDVLEEIYTTYNKLEPKNLILSEFLTMVIEKDLIKNSNNLLTFVDLYEEVRGKNIDQEANTLNKNTQENDEQKFNKKKFEKLLKDVAKTIFPGHTNAYETVLFNKLRATEFEEHRMRLDENVKKYLNQQTVKTLADYTKQFETIFQIYMPENYNKKLNFTWKEIKLLEKKLPIMCMLRFLNEAEVCPHTITVNCFYEATTKLIPPSSNSNHKQAKFYYQETFPNYMREEINNTRIKLLDGDAGLTFLEFQLLIVRFATEFCRETKTDFTAYIHKLFKYMKMNEISDKETKFQKAFREYHQSKETQPTKFKLTQKEQKSNIEDLYDSSDDKINEQNSKTEFHTMRITPAEVDNIKRTLNQELQPLPPGKEIEKENAGFFDVEKKHVVIGQQLPKIPDKNKPAPAKDSKKKEDPLLGFKAEQPKKVEKSSDHYGEIIQRDKKLRTNNEFPIILSEIFYPSALPTLYLNSRVEVYLETAYIHMGQRLYEKAYINYCKARAKVDNKTTSSQFYFDVLAAQLFESARKDDLSLLYFHRAKEISQNFSSSDTYLKAFAYLGLGSCLFHLEEYQYSLRCFYKVQAMSQETMEVDSLDNAYLQNNIACCLMMLNRNREAIRLFDLGHHILDLKMGRLDERTLAVQQNVFKNRKANIQMMPEFRTMWKTYAQKINPKGNKNDKKGAKKKK